MTTQPDISRRLIAELLGTATLVLAVIGSGVMAERLAGGNEAIALLGNTLPTGIMLIVLMIVLGPVSGAHLNPAVSIAMALRKALPGRLLVPYVSAQVAGGVAGVVMAHAMLDLPLLQVAATGRSGMGQWTGELAATFGFVVTILGCMRYRPEALPAAAGLSIIATSWCTSSTSFANPAVTVARTLTDTFTGIDPADVPPFLGLQVAGALLAVGLCRWLFAAAPLAVASAPAEPLPADTWAAERASSEPAPQQA